MVTWCGIGIVMGLMAARVMNQAFINGPSRPYYTSLHLENDASWETPKTYGQINLNR